MKTNIHGAKIALMALCLAIIITVALFIFVHSNTPSSTCAHTRSTPLAAVQIFRPSGDLDVAKHSLPSKSKYTSPTMSEWESTRKMYTAHAPLRVPEVADPSHEANREVLQTMIFKALRRQGDDANK